MMQPMPLMKPEITGKGTKVTKRPRRRAPKTICSMPPMITTVKAIAGCSANCITTAVMTTVIGPVGPETWAGVPPNTAAKKPTKMAP